MIIITTQLRGVINGKDRQLHKFADTLLVVNPISIRALCVQMDFIRTFETTTKFNNKNHVLSRLSKILFHRRLWYFSTTKI